MAFALTLNENYTLRREVEYFLRRPINISEKVGHSTEAHRQAAFGVAGTLQLLGRHSYG